jgi:trehalose 6-phosphate phosphatase
VDGHAGHTRGVSVHAPATELLSALIDDPHHSAVLLDVDGTLAPIVRHSDDAMVPVRTRSLLSAIAKRYAVVACVSGRRASDTRRIVSIGSIAYIGNHGGEVLPAGSTQVQIDPELRAWTHRIRDFTRAHDTPELRRVRVRFEDKGPIIAFHWRGAPDETEAEMAVRAIASDAEAEDFQTHWGRKVLEVRPRVQIDKGVGVRKLLGSADVVHAMYAGDDTTDLDAFRALADLAAEGRLQTALRVGVRSDEGPAEIEREADLLVDGPSGVYRLLESLIPT